MTATLPPREPREARAGQEAREVYDNPHYSHIMIGGQPFFILPSGELSGHVPVPRSPDTCAVTHGRESHVYQHASSTYRSTSDYDTDSSTFRPESDTGFPPPPRCPACRSGRCPRTGS